MKSINTVSLFITLCLTVLITVFLTSASAQATQLPKTQIEKADTLNKDIFKTIAKETLAESMANLQLATNMTTEDILLAEQVKNLNVNNTQGNTKVNAISE